MHSIDSDRALIATLTYSFARITAALKMKVEDLRPQRRRLAHIGGIAQHSRKSELAPLVNSFPRMIKWRSAGSLSFLGCRVLVSEYLNNDPKQPNLKTLQDTLAARGCR